MNVVNVNYSRERIGKYQNLNDSKLSISLISGTFKKAEGV